MPILVSVASDINWTEIKQRVS